MADGDEKTESGYLRNGWRSRVRLWVSGSRTGPEEDVTEVVGDEDEELGGNGLEEELQGFLLVASRVPGAGPQDEVLRHLNGVISDASGLMSVPTHASRKHCPGPRST